MTISVCMAVIQMRFKNNNCQLQEITARDNWLEYLICHATYLQSQIISKCII